MYLALWSLAPAEGSLVQELYPDRWEDNPGGTGKKRPFYSNANIQGAAQAGLEISKRIRPDAKPPISVMFTVANDQARTALARAISIWASPSLGPPIVSDLSSPNSSQAQRPDMDAAGVGDLPGIDEDK
jgi:hypothetical protein